MIPFTELGKTRGETSMGKNSVFNRSNVQSYLSSFNSTAIELAVICLNLGLRGKVAIGHIPKEVSAI